MLNKTKIGILLLLFLGRQPLLQAQRVYTANSVLATGNWIKIGIKQAGVYKIDAASIASMNLAAGSIGSASIKLFGNGGAMLPEPNAQFRNDDLVENAIEVVDGGDGIFSGNDYLLFYANGPHQWLKDSLNKQFNHIKNLYADTAYYYLSIGGTGKRLNTKTAPANSNTVVNSFNERYFYENDLVNLQNSGKEWLGESFSSNGSLAKTFSIDWPGMIAPVTLKTSVAARSINSASSFAIQMNGQTIMNINIPAVSGYFLDAYALAGNDNKSSNVTSTPISLNYTYQTTVAGAEGWLNWFELHGRRSLIMNGTNQLPFRDWASVAAGNIAKFTISNTTANTNIWDITNPLNPEKINGSLSGTDCVFLANASQLREYIAFDKTNVFIPVSTQKISNQNLHQSSVADYIIVTDASFISAANQLAAFHTQQDQYRTVVATTQQIFQEFSGGIPDPTAIRDFVKMYYDKAGAVVANRPKYLLLLGAASFDYKNRITNNTNLVPGYESVNSFDPLLTHTSDDFFALLDDADDINMVAPAGLLDIGVGRIPARNLADAQLMVQKIIQYYQKASIGPWRNQAVFIADDKDANLHLNDAESLVNGVSATDAFINSNKIYLDAYPLVSGSGGARYPAVNDAIVNSVFNGALIVNYSGHGNSQRLAEETILSQTELNRFNNANKLPLFITASCDFAPYDDPSKTSLGANLLMGNANGAIALMTTTRVVFAYSNRIINDNYLRIALQPKVNGQYMSLGEAVMAAKNSTYQLFGDVFNNRKFTLLGDPAMRLAFPTYRLQLTKINNQALHSTDSLQALGKYSFDGIVTDALGNAVTDFNGIVYPTVYDKAQTVKTLGNDPASPVTSFTTQNSVLYKGSASVTKGRFQFSFIVPKDINYQSGFGKISLYANNGLIDATGVNNSIFIGGLSKQSTDNIGPTILGFINDENFKNGGLSNENPVLLLQLFDSSGISTSGAGIGHDITAVIDGNERDVLVLNDYYTAINNSYQAGLVRYQLPTLSEGQHRIRIKAWDVANNSSEIEIVFVLAKQATLLVKNLLNYPNPFNSLTHFSFEHNQPNTSLDVSITIFNTIGQLVKTIQSTINTAGTRNCSLDWNGTDENGRKLKKGIYIYQIKVSLNGVTYQEAKQLLLF